MHRRDKESVWSGYPGMEVVVTVVAYSTLTQKSHGVVTLQPGGVGGSGDLPLPGGVVPPAVHRFGRHSLERVPNHQRAVGKNGSSAGNTYTLRTRLLHVLAPDLHAQ